MKKILEIRKKRVEHFAKIRAKQAQKIKDQYDKNQVKRDIALIRSPASNISLKQLANMAKSKAKVKIIRDEEDIEVDTDEEEQYNYSDQEAEMEAEVNI